jgi:hypothetical protein
MMLAFFNCIHDRIEYRHAENTRAAFTRSDPGYDLRAIFDGPLGLKRAVFTRDTLDEQPRIFID